MKSILSSLSKRKSIALGVLSILCILSSFPLRAQQASNFELTTTVTHGTCEADGEIAAAVTSKNPIYTINNVVYTYYNETSGAVVTTVESLTSKATGLPAGTYKVEAKVLINGVGAPVVLRKGRILVTSSYRVPTIAFAAYRPSFKEKATGMISVRVTNGSANEYTVKLTVYPPTYTGYKEFTFAKTNDTKYFYNLPKGSYTVQVSDACNNYPAQEIYISDDGLPANIEKPAPEPIKRHCGWYSFQRPFNEKNLYMNNVDTLKKYLEIGFDKKANLIPGNTSVWKNFENLPATLDDAQGIAFDWSKYPGNTPLSLRLKNGDTWYKIAHAAEADRYVLAYRVRGTNEIKTYHLDFYDKGPWTSSYIVFAGFPCNGEKYSRKTWLAANEDVAYCAPVTVTVAEKDNPNVQVTDPLTLTADNIDWRNGVPYKDRNDPSKDYLFDPKKEYIITVTDANNDVQKMEMGKMDPKLKYFRKYRVLDYCRGVSETNFYFGYGIPIAKVIPNPGDNTVYRENTDIVSLAGYTITLIEVPSGFTPAANSLLKLNVPYNVPANFGKEWFTPFGKEGLSGYLNQFEYAMLAPGEYKIKVKDKCGNERIETFKIEPPVEKFSLGSQSPAPKIEVKECGRVRIYPFSNGIENLILKNGASYTSDDLYIHITDLPEGVHEADVRVGTGGKSLWLKVKADADKCYFDLPRTNGSMKMSLKIKRVENGKDVVIYPDCIHNETSVDLANANLGYDRDSYVGYKCPSGTVGYVSFMPINYVGNLDVAIRKTDGTTTVEEKKNVTVNPNQPIEFNLKSTDGTPLDDDYLLYLKDLKCKNDNGVGTPITLYDVNSISIVRTTWGNSKYCEGDKIKLEAVSLGGEVRYQWTLPDGTKYPTGGPSKTARVYEITHATNAQHSGEYTLVAENIICDGAPASTEVKFTLSVAPPVLWWASNAVDANWYNVKNWRKEDGGEANAIPALCTTIHIPAEVDTYFPDLDPDVSKYDVKKLSYGAAECNDVYFHYGSQMGYPQRLHYSHAYVDYNFGKMQGDGTLVAHAEANFPKSDKRLMERDRWYMLATPLKNILSGDFGLAGYPMTFQRHFKSGLTDASGLTEGSFEKPVNTLVENMNEFNYAIALKVAGYNASKVGYKEHTNLNALHGIIRVPFYLFDAEIGRRHLHFYDGSTQTSTFRYYSMRTLAPMTKFDSYIRKPEKDFRFVFEDGTTNAIGAISVAGQSVEGYAFQLTGDTNSELRMVGNPFMSAIDFDKLVDVNSSLIEPYYYIFTNSTWKVYYSGVTSPASTLQKEILPLQAIVIKKKAMGELLFPTLGDKNVLLAPNKGWTLQSLTTNSSDPVRRVSVVATNSAGQGGESILLPDTELSPAPALFYPAIDEVPTVYFVDTEEGTPNVIQSGASLSVVPMGVHSSLMGTIELDFSSLTSNLFTRLSLYDRATRREHDLLANPRYTYQNGANEGTRFELRMEYPGVKSVTSPHTAGDLLRVILGEDGYRVESAVSVQGYTLYGVDGKQLTMDEGVNALQFVVDRVHCQSVTLLRVHLADGSTLTRKLPAL